MNTSPAAALLEDLQQPERWASWGRWLTSQGDARGRVIEIEQRLAAPAATDDCAALKAEYDALVAAHGARWKEGVPTVAGLQLFWKHGFIVGAQLDWSHMGDVLDALSRAPSARFLQRLDVVCAGCDLAGLEAMLSRAVFDSMRTLMLLDSELGDDAAEVVARSERLGALTHLAMDACGLGARGAGALVRSPGLRGLRVLELNQNTLGDDGAAALAGAPEGNHLTTLSLRENRVGSRGALALAQAPHLALRVLDMANNHLGVEGLRALVSAPGFRLERLRVKENRVGPEGGRAIAEAKTLSALTELDLSANKLGDAGAVALAGAGLPLLDLLWLNLDGIGDAGAVALAGAAWPKLKTLFLRDNDVGDAGARALAAVPSLTLLGLESNRVSADTQALLAPRASGIYLSDQR